ncbi:MAG: uroporphyrinogen-III synthase, partial [Planctomycetota bacterium]
DPFRVAQQAHRDLVAALGPARRLEGRVVGLCRPEPSSDRLAIALREAGATVIEVAVSRRVEVHDAEASARARSSLGSATWCLFTSAAAVEAGLRWLREDAPGREALARVQIGVVGPATREAVEGAGLEVALEAPAGSGAGLARALLERLGPGAPPTTFLWPTARHSRPELSAILEGAGHRVLTVPLYEIRPMAPGEGVGLPDGAVDVVVVTSPSVVQAAVALGVVPVTLPVIAIGPTTASAAERHGLSVVATAPRPTPQALIEVIP